MSFLPSNRIGIVTSDTLNAYKYSPLNSVVDEYHNTNDIRLIGLETMEYTKKMCFLLVIINESNQEIIQNYIVKNFRDELKEIQEYICN